MRMFRIVRMGETDYAGLSIKDSAIYCLVAANTAYEAELIARQAHSGWGQARLSVIEVSLESPQIIETKYLP